MIDPGLDEKVALVSGANHGIGAGIARSLSAQGVKVFVQFLRLPLEYQGVTEKEAERVQTAGAAYAAQVRAQNADEVLATIRDSGGQADAWESDLKNTENIPKLFDRVEQVFGPVDIL